MSMVTLGNCALAGGFIGGGYVLADITDKAYKLLSVGNEFKKVFTGKEISNKTYIDFFLNIFKDPEVISETVKGAVMGAGYGCFTYAALDVFRKAHLLIQSF
jgi:hypothetical protein